jgi:hypothetical protein
VGGEKVNEEARQPDLHCRYYSSAKGLWHAATAYAEQWNLGSTRKLLAKWSGGLSPKRDSRRGISVNQTLSASAVAATGSSRDMQKMRDSCALFLSLGILESQV